MPNEADTHIAEWAELIGDSVPDAVDEDRTDLGDADVLWDVGR